MAPVWCKICFQKLKISTQYNMFLLHLNFSNFYNVETHVTSFLILNLHCNLETNARFSVLELQVHCKRFRGRFSLSLDNQTCFFRAICQCPCRKLALKRGLSTCITFSFAYTALLIDFGDRRIDLHLFLNLRSCLALQRNIRGCVRDF